MKSAGMRIDFKRVYFRDSFQVGEIVSSPLEGLPVSNVHNCAEQCQDTLATCDVRDNRPAVIEQKETAVVLFLRSCRGL